MKKIFIITFIFMFFISIINVKANEEIRSLFPDENFYNCIVKDYNISSIEDLKLIKSLDCGDEYKDYYTRINNVSGIEFLTELTNLNLYQNNLMTIDLSKNTKLEELQIGYNALTQIDLSNNLELTTVALSGNQLNSIDLSNNLKLKSIYLHRNNLYEINFTNNKELTFVQLGSNHLNNIDVSNLLELNFLDISENNVEYLDLSNNLKLTTLNISNNKIKSVKYNNANSLDEADFVNNQLDKSYSNCFNSKKCNFGKVITVKYENKEKYYNLEENSNIFAELSNSEYNALIDDTLSDDNRVNSISDKKFIIIIGVLVVLLTISIILNFLLFIRKTKEVAQQKKLKNNL